MGKLLIHGHCHHKLYYTKLDNLEMYIHFSENFTVFHLINQTTWGLKDSAVYRPCPCVHTNPVYTPSYATCLCCIQLLFQTYLSCASTTQGCPLVHLVPVELFTRQLHSLMRPLSIICSLLALEWRKRG